MTSPRKISPILLGTILLVPMAALEVWAMSVSIDYQWSRFGQRYSELADGFLHGRLSLRMKPNPDLLSLPDPYDPKANWTLREQDLTLFGRKYYLYWGPVPALGTAAVCWPLRIRRPMIGDQWLTFLFMVGTVGLAMRLIFDVRQRLFPKQCLSTAVMAAISLGMGTPLLYLMTRAFVWETAIVSGQLFLLAGLWFAWLGMSGSRPRNWPFLLAGMCWALAIGSRLSLPPAVAVVSLITIWQLRATPRPMPAICGLLAPLAAGAALLAWYNFARFGSVTEFGWRYQLAGQNQHAMSVSDAFSLGNVIPNLCGYLLNPPHWTNGFPFLKITGATWLTRPFHLSRDYVIEPFIGLVWSQPFLALAFPALTCRRHGDRLLSWLVLSLAAAGLLGFIPALTMPANVNRYLMDLLPSATILAAVGYWQLLERLEGRPQIARSTRRLVCLLVLAQAIFGIGSILERPNHPIWAGAGPASTTLNGRPSNA
jgi:hypothetical protein